MSVASATNSAPFVANQLYTASKPAQARSFCDILSVVLPVASMPQSSSDFLGSDPFHETFRPLFRRLASFPLVLGCSRPLIGADTESSEVVQETPHPLLFMLLPRSLRRPPVLRTPRTSTVPYCSLAFRRDQLLLWGLPLVVPSQSQSLHYQHGRPSPKPSQERK